jgi:PASTA domain
MSASARVFAITTETDAIPLALRRGEVSYTVSNSSGRPLRGRARVVPLGSTQAAWLSLAGEAERDFAAAGVHQFTVQLAVPPEAPAGKYPFRLEVASVQNPDEEFAEGQTVTATVLRPLPNGTRFPWWMIAAAALALVVVVGGVAAWMFWPQGTIVPDVVGQPIEEARRKLAEAHLKVTETQEPRPNVSPGHVVEQTPSANEEVARDTTVTLVVAVPPPPPQKVEVPNVVGIPFEQAEEKLQRANLKVANKGPQATLEFDPGEVWKQEPEAFASVDPGTTVSLVFAGPSVKVPQVKGRLLLNALLEMRAARLRLKVTGDENRLGEPVVDTSPTGDAVVLQDSEVTVIMPGRERILDPRGILQFLDVPADIFWSP